MSKRAYMFREKREWRLPEDISVSYSGHHLVPLSLVVFQNYNYTCWLLLISNLSAFYDYRCLKIRVLVHNRPHNRMTKM